MKTLVEIRADIEFTKYEITRTTSWKRKRDLKRHIEILEKEIYRRKNKHG